MGEGERERAVVLLESNTESDIESDIESDTVSNSLVSKSFKTVHRERCDHDESELSEASKELINKRTSGEEAVEGEEVLEGEVVLTRHNGWNGLKHCFRCVLASRIISNL